MPDLKMTTKDAIAAVQQEAKRAAEGVQYAVERALEELKAIDQLRTAVQPTIDTADVACVLDLTIPGFCSSSAQLSLNINGGCNEQVHIRPPKPGRYRALILMTKLPDK